MSKSEKELRQDIVDIGKLVYQKGWVAANDGNITIRLDQDRILATPTGVSKGMMHPDDLIIVDMQGNKIEGRKERTSEIAMHTTIYNLRPDIRSVVHAHPPVSTGFAAAGRPLNLALLPEVIIGLGCVPLASYGLPGTPELTEPMLPEALYAGGSSGSVAGLLQVNVRVPSNAVLPVMPSDAVPLALLIGSRCDAAQQWAGPYYGRRPGRPTQRGVVRSLHRNIHLNGRHERTRG